VALRIFLVGVLLVVIAACGDPLGEPTTTSGSVSEDQVVKITFERSGGFAGMTRTLEVSTDELSAQEAAEVRRLIDEARFFELPEQIDGDGTVGDEFTYVVVIETGERRSVVRTGAAGAPETLLPLLDWLNRAARSGGR
jgi:hypothetical protein